MLLPLQGVFSNCIITQGDALGYRQVALWGVHICAYSNTRKALLDHVDDEDKGVTKRDTLGGTQKLTVINESGIYSLILSSKLPQAKAFKRWVTSEVLPQIRMTGGYIPMKDADGRQLSSEEILDRADVIIGRTLRMLNGLTDYTQFSSSMGIAEMFLGIMAGNNIKEGELTLLNDLTGTMKVKDCAKVVEIQNMMAHARRNYADEATIEKYTQQLNELVSGTMSCAHNNQQIPWKMQTVKFGVDYWAVPAMQFAAGSSYEPLTDMLDKESIAYMINIADHAAEPIKESLVTVRQLMQYMQKIMGIQQNQQNQQNP